MQNAAYVFPYYIYVLFFGTYVSVKIACGNLHAREWRAFCILCPALLLLQGICVQLWDMDLVWLFYPLITHLPVVLVLLLLRVRLRIALVSVAISYSMCQLIRWVGLVIYALGWQPALSVALHLALSQLVLMLMDRFCFSSLHRILFHSPRMLGWFGMLPAIYYLYEYFMLFTGERFAAVLALHELLPTAMMLFFLLFAIAYWRELERRREAEQQKAALESQLKQAEHGMELLRVVQEQTAIHRHDLRHHLSMIHGFLKTNPEQAALYIENVTRQADEISPVRYCENEAVNLALTAAGDRAARAGIRMDIRASLPGDLPLSDAEMGAMLSNGLENALNAVCALPEAADRHVDVFCGVRQNNLLVEIKNPCAGDVVLRDGIPVRTDGKEHYGCRSIRSIVTKRKGVCSFGAADGTFTLRIAIPLQA